MSRHARMDNPPSLTRQALLHSARTAVAAVLSFLLARALKLPEFYWAPISTIVILLAPSDPFTLSWQRFAGTAVGAIVGAIAREKQLKNWRREKEAMADRQSESRVQRSGRRLVQK
jgi:uncharacterized membrane protein YccC